MELSHWFKLLPLGDVFQILLVSHADVLSIEMFLIELVCQVLIYLCVLVGQLCLSGQFGSLITHLEIKITLLQLIKVGTMVLFCRPSGRSVGCSTHDRNVWWPSLMEGLIDCVYLAWCHHASDHVEELPRTNACRLGKFPNEIHCSYSRVE